MCDPPKSRRSLQRAQEHVQQGMQQLEIVFQGLRSQISQDKVRMQGHISESLEGKLNQPNSQIASLVQALESCEQTMVSFSSLEALQETGSMDVGHLSAQLKSLQCRVSTSILPQFELLSGTENSLKKV